MMDIVDKLHSLLEANKIGVKINYFDIGASGGFSELWNHSFINLFGFEPDKHEYENLLRKKASNQTFFNTALYDKKGKITINVCRKQQVSSILEPNLNYLKHYPDVSRFDIISKYDCYADTLDKVCTENRINFDAIKIDTQGTALNILRGAENALKNALCVEVETEFQEFYKNQPLFSGVDSYLRENNFRLIDINRVEWTRNSDLNFTTRKELIFCDGIYFKDLIDLQERGTHVSKEEVLKLMLISLNYNFLNYSYYLFTFFKFLFESKEYSQILDFYISLSIKVEEQSKVNPTFKMKVLNKVKRVLNVF